KPASKSSRIKRDIKTVSPGSSSSNAPMHTSEYSLRTYKVVVKRCAPTGLVDSRNGPKAFFAGAACHKEASRCVFPTPKPSSTYTPFGSLESLFFVLRENSEKRPP